MKQKAVAMATPSWTTVVFVVEVVQTRRQPGKQTDADVHLCRLKMNYSVESCWERKQIVKYAKK